VLTVLVASLSGSLSAFSSGSGLDRATSISLFAEPLLCSRATELEEQ
jgi:hypothetical protein